MREIINMLHSNQAGSLYSVAAITALILLSASFQVSAAGKEKEGVPTQTPGAQTSDNKFNKLDFNQDGKISHEEASGDKGLASSFDILDTNADGTLDAKEYGVFTSSVQKK